MKMGRLPVADPTKDIEHWSAVAAEWIAWARAPNHDAFWAYRGSLLAFIGRGVGDALDLGCGEGRVSRVLKSCGYRVTAVDVVGELVEAARQVGSADDYAVAAATALPFAEAGFDLVVAYNVLMDLDDVPGAIAEIRRVLRPSGYVLVSIVHPFADRGTFDGFEPDAPFVIKETYFGRRRFESIDERAGLRMSFAGWSQPLEAYAAALESAGLAITSIREPVPNLGEGRDHMQQWSRIPLFLWIKARRL